LANGVATATMAPPNDVFISMSDSTHSTSHQALRESIDGKSGLIGRFNFGIFKARGVRQERLHDTPYRFWSTYAIAYVFGRRLSGTVDVLDAGGCDGGTLKLLENLSLSGTYTCLDLAPTMGPPANSSIEVTVIQSSFADFKPPRRYDAVLFESSLECVENYQDVAWLRNSLNPKGFAVITLATRNTEYLWGDFPTKGGGRYYLDYEEIALVFGAIGLKAVEFIPLVGVSGRLANYLLHNYLCPIVRRVFKITVGRLHPRLAQMDPMWWPNRLISTASVVLDRLLCFWPVGHCIVLERA